jgi:hypothetical protein
MLWARHEDITMKTVEEILQMDIEEIKSNFLALMSDIVTEHGDDQEETNAGEEKTDAK